MNQQKIVYQMQAEVRKIKETLIAEQSKALRIISHVSRDCPAYRNAMALLDNIRVELNKLNTIRGN